MATNGTAPTVVECFVDLIRKKETAKVLKMLSDSKFDPNAVTKCILGSGKVTKTDYSLLMYASHYDNVDVFRELIEMGADPLYRNNYGSCVMTMLAKRGQLQMAEYSVRKLSPNQIFALVNIQSNKGWTPLMASVQNNQIRMFKLLLEKGAYVNRQMLSGCTAWHLAVKNGNRSISDILALKKDRKHLESLECTFFGIGDKVKPGDLAPNSSFLDAKKIQKDRHNSAVKAREVFVEEHANTNPDNGEKAMIVLIYFTKFDSDQLGDLKDTSEWMKISYENAIDCEVLVFDDEIKTKENYLKFLERVKDVFRKKRGEFGIVKFVICSHGGTDERGQEFFYDTQSNRIFVDQDLRNQFSIAHFSPMEDLAVIFFINSCRTNSPDEHRCAVARKESTVLSSRNLTVFACQKWNGALHNEFEGTQSIFYFLVALDEVKAKLHLKDLFGYVQKFYIDVYMEMFHVNNSIVIQELDITDNLHGKSVWFRPKPPAILE